LQWELPVRYSRLSMAQSIWRLCYTARLFVFTDSNSCVVIITFACDLQSSWDRRAILLLAASALIDGLSQDHSPPSLPGLVNTKVPKYLVDVLQLLIVRQNHPLSSSRCALYSCIA